MRGEGNVGHRAEAARHFLMQLSGMGSASGAERADKPL